MSKSLFIIGTDTDIGKTYISGLLLKKLNELNLNCAYYKAAMSGNERDGQGNLLPGDALQVKSMSKIEQKVVTMCPFVYEQAVSPHLASRTEGELVDLGVVKNGYEDLSRKYEYILMEGSGGIFCPLRYDKEKIMLEDVIKHLDMDCLLIADAGLGTINHVALTATYLASQNIKLKGIVFNNFVQGNPLHLDNLKMCEELTNSKVIACVEKDAKNLDIDEDLLLSLFK